MLQRTLTRHSKRVFDSSNVCVFCNALYSFDRSWRRSYVARKAPKAPSVIKARIDRGATQTPSRTQDHSVAFPSPQDVEMFKSASTQGFLPINHSDAILFLKRLVEWKTMPSEQELKRACKETNVPLNALTPLAHIILSNSGKIRRDIGTRLINSASAAGSPEATLYIMRAALVASDFESPHAKSAFPRLLSLTQENNIDAVSLLGQIYMKQNKPAEAQELLSKAMTLKSSPISSPTTIPSPDPTLSTGPNPSTTLGLLHLQQKDIESALETFKTAAHTHDDPNAFYHLSTLEPRYSTRWIDYTLRAASSGHRTAAYNLGIFYALPLHEVLQRLDSSGRNELARFEKWWDGLLGQRESRRKKWALEWWYTAAMDGHAPAFLVYLKALWEGEGREECVTALAGLSVLVRDEGGGFAAQWPDVVEEARRYLRAWEREWEEWLEEDGGRKAREKLEALRGRSELGFRAWLYNI